MLAHPRSSRQALRQWRTVILDSLIAHRWLALSAVAVVSLLAHVGVRGWSWHYITTGVRVLFSPSGLHLYSRHPELQMGPLTFVLAALFVIGLKGVVGSLAANCVMMIAGLLAVREVGTFMNRQDSVAQRRWFASSVLVLVVWSEIAVRWGHLDDAMALLAGIVGLRLARSNSFIPAALAIGVAVGFKPWAVPFAAVLLLADRRRLLAAGAVLSAVVALTWGWFVLLDPAALGALHFHIRVDRASTLRLLNVADATTPAWCRPVQLLGGLAIAGLAVRRGRWAAVLMLVIALRLLVDPATKNYYDGGLVLGTALFDVASTTAVLPLLTLIAALGVYLPSYLLVGEPPLRAALRTATLVAILAVGFLARPNPAKTADAHDGQDDRGSAPPHPMTASKPPATAYLPSPGAPGI